MVEYNLKTMPDMTQNEVVSSFPLQSVKMQLGWLYNSSNATKERGFYTFSVLLQSFQTLQLLDSLNVSSDDLTILTVILNGVLDDSCQWVSATPNSSPRH